MTVPCCTRIVPGEKNETLNSVLLLSSAASRWDPSGAESAVWSAEDAYEFFNLTCSVLTVDVLVSGVLPAASETRTT